MDSRSGLTTSEATARRIQYGPNALPPPPREALAVRLLRQFRSPLIYLLVFALAVDLAVWVAGGGRGVPLESLAIAAILFLNASLGTWQEYKADHILEDLKALAAPRVWTWRDDLLTHLPAAELVPGDLVRLEPGDRVPADLLAKAVSQTLVDEAVLTGESLPVEKLAGDALLAGTLLVRGTARAEVLRTGPSSAMGRLSLMLGTIRREPTPLERQLASFGSRMARIVLVLALLLVAGGVLAEGPGRLWRIVLFAAALAVASVPEGLPAVMTLTLMLGVQRMARRRALVRKLVSVETLGSVTVIATDKTGTLTEGRLEVHAFDSADLAGALAAAILASNPEAASGAADPLDAALLRHAAQTGAEPARLHSQRPRTSERPFDAAWAFTRATVLEHGYAVSYLKGAPEGLLDRCTMPDAERAVWRQRIEARANEGYRVLGLARGAGEREAGLDWLGLVLLWDPPRPEVPDAVARARRAGIRIIMLTGDHPGTALTAARAVGIEHHAVLTGDDIEGLSAPALREAVRATPVFARLLPEHKLRIVEALQADGEVVAVTGDGVNDAPALKRADVGVAMGERGSDLARDVADLVLLDDNFATIVVAIEEGRGIYENIQKFVRFLLATNSSEVLVVTLGAVAAFLLGLRDADGWVLIPLTAMQLLWINLISDGAPALALALDRNPGVMDRPPRAPSRPLLDGPSRRFIVLSAALQACIALGLLALVPYGLGRSAEVAASAAFLYMTTTQLLFAYPARRTDLQPPPNPALRAAILVSLAVQVLVMVMPPLRAALGTAALPPVVWSIVAAGLAVTWLIVGALQRRLWPRKPEPAPGAGS